MIQQGQVFKLKSKGPDGQLLWAYRYRLEGRDSQRPQAGRVRHACRGGEGAAQGARPPRARWWAGDDHACEFADEYLEMHQAAPVTVAKLRWPLRKATADLGERPAVDLAPRDVYAWRRW